MIESISTNTDAVLELRMNEDTELIFHFVRVMYSEMRASEGMRGSQLLVLIFSHQEKKKTVYEKPSHSTPVPLKTRQMLFARKLVNKVKRLFTEGTNV